jgi:hypothetical protein
MRDFLRSRPVLGWVLAAILMLATAFLLYRNFKGDEVSALTQMVTIRCNETGETWTMLRGAMERELYDRPFPVDPSAGLVNPKTGKFTGFPVDDWKLTIDRINAERKAVRGSQPSTP